jgi:hypothetical protein
MARITLLVAGDNGDNGSQTARWGIWVVSIREVLELIALLDRVVARYASSCQKLAPALFVRSVREKSM